MMDCGLEVEVKGTLSFSKLLLENMFYRINRKDIRTETGTRP